MGRLDARGEHHVRILRPKMRVACRVWCAP